MFNDVLKLILDNDDKKGRTGWNEGIDLKSYDDYNDTDSFDYEYQIVKEEETEPKYRSMKNTKPKDMQNVVEGKKMFMRQTCYVEGKPPSFYTQKVNPV